MLSTLTAIAGILITLIFVIGTHEAAHFYAAKCLGVKVLKFSIGFGKALFKWHDRTGTEYAIAMIPLGGYVKMLDEQEDNVPEHEKHLAYNRQPYYKKFLIVAAGPMANLLCAFLLYWGIFSIGFITLKPIVGQVTPHSLAAQAGLKAKDEIVAVDNEKTLSWTHIIFQLLTHAGNVDQARLTLIRQAKTIHLQMPMQGWQMDPLKPDALASLGITPVEIDAPLTVGSIKPNSPAAHAGLTVGDRLLSIHQQKITAWGDLIRYVQAHPDTVTTLTIARKQQVLHLSLHIGSSSWLGLRKHGVIGITPPLTAIPQHLIQHVHYPFAEAAEQAWLEIKNFTTFNFLLFGKLISGKMSLQSLGGPITIFESAGQALNSGWLAFVNFLAFLSVSIGVINLLPIPGLDGGHLLIQTIEAAMGRPLPETLLLNLYRAGFALLIFVLIQALANDVLRLH